MSEKLCTSEKSGGIELEETVLGTNSNPWDSEAFTDFLNDINEIATEKYGWNVDGFHFETNELLQLILQPAIGSDSLNRKF